MKKKQKFQMRYLVILAMVLISAYCIKEVVEEVNTTFALKSDIKIAEKEKADLEEQKALFEKEKSNLNNTDYIVRYARGRYMLTKEGQEQVFKLPAE